MSCLAWGLTYARGVCEACYNFAARYKTISDCAGCGRSQLLRRGYCRLCWCQAYRDRPTGPNTPLAPYLARVRDHQLFLADLNSRRAAPKAFPRRFGAKGRPLKTPPPVVDRPLVGWVQPPLFDEVMPRRYRWQQTDLRNGPPPDNPWLAYGLHIGHTLAERRGFSGEKWRHLQRTLVMLLTEHRDGELIRASDFDYLVRRHGGNVEHVVEVLTTMGVLADDRPATFDSWLTDKLDGLAGGIRIEAERWTRALRDGGPRMRARSERTARGYLGVVGPALTEWSTGYAHLREVTRDDVLTHLDGLRGQHRDTTLVALRSLFRWAKKNNVVFRDPTIRLRGGSAEDPLWQPLAVGEIAQTIAAATTPHARVAVALASVHAARHGAIRAMRLDDVDLANRRVTVAGRTRPLDDLTYRVLTDWLDYRRQRWPNTANLHLLVSRDSAVNLGPVSAPWIGRLLRGLPATLERLRIDRQLEEALASGADPLHLAAVFDVSDTTAVRYAENARALLPRPHETPTPASSATQASRGDDERSAPLGSG